MAQQRVFAEGENRGDPAAAVSQAAMADGVDAPVYPVQPTDRQSISDRSSAETELGELAPRDYTVLPGRDRRHLSVTWATLCTILVP
jgi:hypothetical protein